MDQLKAAAAKAFVLGVQILIVLAVVIAGSGWVFADYFRVREWAANGNRVYQSILEQQKKTAKPGQP